MAIETLMHNTEPLGALLGDASDIIFDNGGTSLESTDVEGALKEVNSAIPNVVDNLTSTSTTDALSAYQGKVLNDKIDETNSKMSGMVTCSATASQSITVLANSTSDTNLTSMPTTPSGKSIIGFVISSDEGAKILEKIAYIGGGNYSIHAENRTSSNLTVNVVYRVLYV